MNAHAFRHFYDYHFAENRKLWDKYVTQLSEEQFTQHVAYSRGSVRDQILHLISCDATWFSGLRGVDIPEDLHPAGFEDREGIRAHWDNVEHTMRAYLEALRDEMLFDTPLEGEDKALLLWQVLLHVANHGTDHRAQLLRLLNDMGIRTEYQDYIFYAYENTIQTPQGKLTTKSELLKWLQDEYRQWEDLLAQIGPARMDQPGVNGQWSMKDIAAHLTGWQRRVVSNLQAAQRGEPEPRRQWPAHLEAEDDINAWIYESNRGRSVREVLDDTEHVFQQLLAVIEGFRDDIRVEHIEPALYLVRVDDKRFLTGEFFNHFHDDHEPEVRAWLAHIEQQ